MKESTCDRIGQGFSSPSARFIKPGLYLSRMNKELLQVQEWTQKRGHTHTPITSVKGPGSTIGFLIYVPGRKQPLSFRMLVFVIKY